MLNSTASVTHEAPSLSRGRGRPRDESLHRRVVEVAIDIYAEQGWSGFNFEVVAGVAGVGRPALYRRWPDRSALLIDAILSTTPEVMDVDLGSLYDELFRLLDEYRRVMQGNRMRAGVRLYLDVDIIPDVVEAVHERLMGRRSEVVSAAIARASARAGRPSSIPDRLAFTFLLSSALQWSTGNVAPPPAIETDAIVSAVVALTGLANR